MTVKSLNEELWPKCSGKDQMFREHALRALKFFQLCTQLGEANVSIFPCLTTTNSYRVLSICNTYVRLEMIRNKKCSRQYNTAEGNVKVKSSRLSHITLHSSYCLSAYKVPLVPWPGEVLQPQNRGPTYCEAYLTAI